MYFGVFTATEAAGVGAISALFIATVVYRNFGWNDLLASAKETTQLTAMLFMILASAAIFGHVLTVMELPSELVASVTKAGVDPITFILLTMAVIFILGMFLETIAIILVTTPIILDFLISDYMTDSFVMPAKKVAIEIGLCLLLPLGLGMAFLKRLPNYAERFSKLCVKGSLVGIGIIVIGSLGAGRLNFANTSGDDIGVLCLFILSLSLVGIWLTKGFGLASEDNRAIEMEVVVRNINLGFLLKVSLFPTVAGQSNPVADMALFSMLLYGAWQMTMGIFLIFWRRRQPVSTAGESIS